MRDEELKLYIELAPKLNEYRGEWQRGDEYFLQDEVGAPILHYIDTCDSCNFEVYECDAIWIPKAIDPADPERIARGEKPRGLWGMVDWSDVTHIDYDDNGTLLIGKWDFGAEDWIWSTGYRTPTEALLLCLKEQWREKL